MGVLTDLQLLQLGLQCGDGVSEGVGVLQYSLPVSRHQLRQQFTHSRELKITVMVEADKPVSSRPAGITLYLSDTPPLYIHKVTHNAAVQWTPELLATSLPQTHLPQIKQG